VTDTPAKALLDWYHQNARDLPWRTPPGVPLPQDADWPYRVWLSEIMLQQTTVAAVRGYFASFTARWPNVAALAAADDAEVMQAWAGLGYYARARNLLACARAIMAEHGGRFPAAEATLRTLPGIGDYTAAAITAFAFGGEAIVIDGNVERVITRLHAIETPLPAARPQIRAALATMDPAHHGDFAQGLMDLASRICTPRNPMCLICPLQRWCQAGDDPARLPPPHPGGWRHIGTVSHGFTHFELALRVMALRLPVAPPIAGDWLARDDVARAGLPTLFQKAASLALAQFPPEDEA
jgi:A/G-specific adenine glycosylase